MTEFNPQPDYWFLLGEAHCTGEEANEFDLHSDNAESVAEWNRLQSIEAKAQREFIEYVIRHADALRAAFVEPEPLTVQNDPLMFEAREITASCMEEDKRFSPERIAVTRSGKRDDDIDVRAVLKALRRGIALAQGDAKC